MRAVEGLRLLGHALPDFLGGVDLLGVAHTHHQQVAQIVDNLPGELARVAASIQILMDFVQPFGGIAFQNGIHDFDDGLAGGRTQHGLRQLQADFL